LVRTGALSVYVARHVARLGSTLLDLTALEFELLYVLARHAGLVLSREQLLNLVWGYDYHDDLRVVDAVVKRLRAKLREAASAEDLIVTVRGVGYKLEA
jgi:DNA-binding response OmpR family regulator